MINNDIKPQDYIHDRDLEDVDNIDGTSKPKADEEAKTNDNNNDDMINSDGE